MEFLLVGVTIVSLGLALAMSVVAWKLLRTERERSAARAEALEALAFTVPSNAPSPSAAPAHHVARRDVHTDTGEADDVLELPTPRDHWDFALGGQTVRGADAIGEPRRPEVLHRDDMFEHTPAPGVAGRRWLALAAVILVIAAGVASLGALRSPEILAAISASRSSTATAAPQPLELLSLRHATDPDGTLTVTGLVQNPADGREVANVEAVVYLFDDTGRFFASGKAGLEVSTVDPGNESPFVVRVANAAGVSRYRVGFRRGDGRVVAHVDRRGQLPHGTTGDALGEEPELATPAGGMRPIQGAQAR